MQQNAIVLWHPRMTTVKECAYAGFAITFVSEFVAPVSAGAPSGRDVPGDCARGAGYV